MIWYNIRSWPIGRIQSESNWANSGASPMARMTWKAPVWARAVPRWRPPPCWLVTWRSCSRTSSRCGTPLFLPRLLEDQWGPPMLKWKDWLIYTCIYIYICVCIYIYIYGPKVKHGKFTKVPGCFKEPFRNSFVAAGPAGPLKPWLHAVDRSWSRGRTEVGEYPSYGFGSKLRLGQLGPLKLGHCMSLSETFPRRESIVGSNDFWAIPCTVLEGRCLNLRFNAVFTNLWIPCQLKLDMSGWCGPPIAGKIDQGGLWLTSVHCYTI